MRYLRDQPVAVWAVAFAAVVSFMGLGLVDPILPAIAHDLSASPSDVELLFTSYFLFTGLSMLFSSVFSSRIGAKSTLLVGLALIVIFSASAGASNSVGAIAGLRAGWGLGNALFIATSLAVIVTTARGGVPAAVMVYEAALGLGVSTGPLLGGELGGISWRGPFFGVGVLMALAFVVIAWRLPRTPRPPREQHVSVVAPLMALRHRAVRGSGLTAVFYNFGFFTLLGWAPFVMHLSVHQLGYTFTAWGFLLAIFAMFVAPWISQRYRDTSGLAFALFGVVVVLALMGILSGSRAAVIACVICSGPFLGITNTLMTQVVMESAPVARPIASSAYSFLRFTGGAISPYIAGKLGEHISAALPFYVGAGMTAISVALLWFYRSALVPVPPAAEEPTVPASKGVIVVAVGGPAPARLCTLAVPLARERYGSVHVLHVREHEVLAGEAVLDAETDGAANDLLETCVAELRTAGVPARGELMDSFGSHAEIANRILSRAVALSATAIVLAPDGNDGPLAGHVTDRVAAAAACEVVVVPQPPAFDRQADRPRHSTQG